MAVEDNVELERQTVGSALNKPAAMPHPGLYGGTDRGTPKPQITRDPWDAMLGALNIRERPGMPNSLVPQGVPEASVLGQPPTAMWEWQTRPCLAADAGVRFRMPALSTGLIVNPTGHALDLLEEVESTGAWIRPFDLAFELDTETI